MLLSETMVFDWIVISAAFELVSCSASRREKDLSVELSKSSMLCFYCCRNSSSAVEVFLAGLS